MLKLHVRINKRITREDRTSETQKVTLKILKKMMISPDAEMMIAPISGTHYIHWKDVFAKFDGVRVIIINGKYSYDVWLTTKQADDLLSFFRHRLENKRKKMENEIIEKTKRSLNIILEEIESEENSLN